LNAPLRNVLAEGAARVSSAALHVDVARSLNDMAQVMAVRTLVYVGEQACPYDEEYDGNDFAGATHLILRAGPEPIGVVRMRWFAGFAKLERLAIRKEYRGGGGLMMLARAAFDLARRKGYRTLMGHAQSRLTPFWKRHFGGWVRSGRAVFAFSGYDYVEMEFALDPPTDAITIDADPFVLLRPEGAWDRPGVLDRSAARPSEPARV
jgi:predicted GNAT family N-acyltransferase